MHLNKHEFLAIVQRAPLVSIDLIVRNPNGQVLLGFRKNEPARNCWFVPGGRICKDESIDAAFRRISGDELGHACAIEDAYFLGVFQHLYQTNFAEEAGFGTHYVVLAYELTYSCLQSALPTEQHDRYQWLDVEGLLRTSEVHEFVKAYFQPGGPISTRYDESSKATQYEIVAASRDMFSQMLWQTPVLSLTAQAFLFTIALSSDFSRRSQVVAASLALITALASIQLLAKHRFNEVEDMRWLESFERKYRYKGYETIHSQRKTKLSWRPGLLLRWISSYRLWMFMLSIFAFGALLILVWPQMVAKAGTDTPPTNATGVGLFPGQKWKTNQTP